MDKLAHPLARGASWLLIYLTAVQPLHPAIAAGIVAANGNTQVVIKPGNVPVVNIATPNGAGISHNTYQDFNVGGPGAVLNNATQGGKTQLGVTIDNGNAKLNGKPAELIINEVTSGNRSELKGRLEVFGNKAGIMIANPNGITCDGCGFINAPSVTLTTGKPQFDKQGALDALAVKKGSVIIGSNGLDGNSAEYVDIISRATELNGKINAKTLTLTQGANRVSFKDGTVKPITGEGAKPQLAVDTKALGGMYAGKIRLVATEAGVGVNLSNVTSTQRDISLTTAGKITLSNVKAQTDLNVSGREIVTPAGSSVRAERDMTLAATTVDNRSGTTAHGDMRVFASTVRNTGEGAALHSNNNLWIQKDAQGNKATLVENRSAAIKTNTGDLVIRTDVLNNARERLIRKEQNTPATSQEIDRSLGSLIPDDSKVAVDTDRLAVIQDPGVQKWFGRVDFKTSPYVNVRRDSISYDVSQAGVISSGANTYLSAGSLLNDASVINSAGNLIMTGATLNLRNYSSGILNTYAVFDVPETGHAPRGKYLTRDIVVNKKGEVSRFEPSGITSYLLSAGNNLVADFSDRIESNEPHPTNVGYSGVITRPDTMTASNILLRAGSINTTDVMKAAGDITLQSDNGTKIALELMMAGKDVSVLASGNIDSWQSELKGQNITLVSRTGDVNSHTSEQPNYFHADGVRWLGSIEASKDLSISAGGNILLRNTRLPVQSQNISLIANGDITLDKNEAMLGHERPGNILTTERKQELFNRMLPGDLLRASGDITLSGRRLSLNGAGIDAGGNISLSSAANTDLNMRSLSDRYSEFFPDSRIPELRSHLKAGGNLLISSAADIGLQGAEVVAGKTATLQAGKLIWLGAYGYGVTDRQNDNNRDELQVTSLLRGVKGLTLAANGDIRTEGSVLSSEGNITLTSGGNTLLEAVQSHSYREGGNDYSERHLWKGSEISAGGMLTIISTGNILFQAARLVVKGLGADWKPAVISGDWVAKLAKAESDLLSWQNTVSQRTNEKNNKEGVVNSKNNYLNQLNGELQAIELEISRLPKNSRGPRLNVLALQKKEKSDEISHVVTELNSLRAELEGMRQQLSVAESERNHASKTLDTARQNAREKGLSEEKLRAEVDAHNQAEAMRSGSMDIAAKGGYLYAQAAEETSLYEKKETKRKWWGHKTEITRTRHDITNKVTEFIAAGNISLLSRDDSTYEASKIEAGKNALLTSLHGRVNFRAVKNSTFEQTVSTSKGFFIKQSNKGYSEGKWVLPSVHAGGQLTVNAAGGISADVKAKNGQALQGAVTALSALPGTEWLKGLNTRSDVQWNTVKDAYDSWNYKSQSLNPAVAAVIAIAAAAVTAGSSLVASAATSVASTVGGGAVATGAVTAGMSSLAAQAAVALVENQGNLSKTLKSLGSSSSVKSLATSMVIGGALAGFDKVMNIDVPPDKAKLPVMVKNEDWGKVVQRVAGQSVISSSLNTGINGGSFKDNLTNALLANIGNQVQAEGAGLIGDNGKVLGIPGRALSHAVVAGISAEIGRGDGKGAAAGALAAELAGVIINDNLVKTEGWQERQAQISRVSGAFVGAIVTGKASGANSGANAGEFVERFNRQLHQEELNAIKELAKGDKEKEARLMAASCRKVACTTQEALDSEERKQFDALMNKYPSTRDEDGLIDNYWVQKERQRFGNYPAFVGYDSEKLFTYDLGDQITDGQLFARNQQIEQISKLTGWSPNWVNASVMAISISNTFAGMGKAGVGNQYLSSRLAGPTSAWKGYLLNEQTIQQAATFRNRVTELRAGLSSDPKRSGNVAVASINVDGMPKEMAAHSSVSSAGKGLVGKGSNNFKYSELPNKAGELIPRNTDSEYKILDNLADKLGKNVAAKGSVTIFTERPACGSCLGVVEQFQQKYPGIKVDVLDNNGIVLRPGAKK